MRSALSALATAALVLAAAAPARAEPPAPDERPERRWSVTSNVIYLVLPVVNASAELRLGDSTSVAGRLGIGRVTIDVPLGGDTTNTVFEIGGEARYYLLGSFRSGLFAGGDVRFTDAGSGALLNVEQALAVGPEIGYKHTFTLGLTLELRGGAQIAFGEADNPVVPLVSLGAGWSF